ncbi:hypothetical protein PCASD_25709, partial [Puccinia coronata f. sp. avenae]
MRMDVVWGLIAARPKGVRMPIRTPNKYGVQPLHAPLERHAGAARHSQHAARHVHAYNRRAHGEQACQTGVQSLHACLEGVQSLHALWTGVQALHACGLTVLVPSSPGSRQPLDSRGLREPHDRDYVHHSSDRAAHVSLSNREAYVSQPRSVLLELTRARVPKPATNHPDPRANHRPRPTATHQTHHTTK